MPEVPQLPLSSYLYNYNIPIAKMQISMSEVILSKQNLKVLVFTYIIASKMSNFVELGSSSVETACVCAPK
jgi:hypothetical protein